VEWQSHHAARGRKQGRQQLANPLSHPPRLNNNNLGVFVMLKWAIIFAIIAIIAGALGFSGVAAGAATIAKLLFFVFLVICVIFLVLTFTAARQL
jgi:uncharacterized membrane protein YtjA (UPF0391 family)